MFYKPQPILSKPAKPGRRPKERHSVHFRNASSLHPRSAPFKQWSEEDLKLACKAVRDGWTIRRAAEEFQVPKSTLYDRISGRVAFGARSGPKKYLSEKEEDELVSFLVGCARIGFARTCKQVLAIVQAVIAKKHGLESESVKITSGWWASFRKHHPKLTLRSASRLAYARAVAQDPEVINAYYDLLEETLIKNDLMDKPGQIFNCDESGFPLDHKPGKVIGLKGQKSLNLTTSGDKAQVTVLACVSATGYVMPPMVIFDWKRLKAELTQGEISGTLYGLSGKGWIDSQFF